MNYLLTLDKTKKLAKVNSKTLRPFYCTGHSDFYVKNQLINFGGVSNSEKAAMKDRGNKKKKLQKKSEYSKTPI